jgi:hypothetical protein
MNKDGKMITGDEAKVTKKQHTSPCSDCPFRRDSIPGWLGTLSVEDWVQLAHGEGAADCHTTKQPGGKGGWACAGLAIYRANICKSPRDAKAMRLKPDTKLVFSFGEFRKHHTEGIKVVKKEPVEKGPKTDEQIDAEIKKLRTMKPTVRHFSMFGDDHWAHIDVQIEVLEGRMDDSEIGDNYDDDDDNSAAHEAVQWMRGEAEEDLAESWKSLVRG